MCSYCNTKVYFNHFQIFCCSFEEAVILHFKQTRKQPSVDFVWVYALSSFKKHEHNGGLRVSRKIKSTMLYLLFGLSKHPPPPQSIWKKKPLVNDSMQLFYSVWLNSDIFIFQ